MGEDGIVLKPFQDEELGSKVAAMLDSARPGEKAAPAAGAVISP